MSLSHQMRWSWRTSDIICSKFPWDSVYAPHHQETDNILDELTHLRNGRKHIRLPSNYGGGLRNRASVNAKVHAGTRTDYNSLKAQSSNLAKDCWHCRGLMNTWGKFSLLLMPLNVWQLYSKSYTDLLKTEPTLTWNATNGYLNDLTWTHTVQKNCLTHKEVDYFNIYAVLINIGD